MSKLYETYKPNVYSSTFMFWGLLWIDSYLLINHMAHSGFSAFVSIITLVFGIISIKQLISVCADLKSAIK